MFQPGQSRRLFIDADEQHIHDFAEHGGVSCAHVSPPFLGVVALFHSPRFPYAVLYPGERACCEPGTSAKLTAASLSMERFLFTFACAVCMTATSFAQASKSSKATEASGISSATCQVSIDSSGHKSAVMTKSTGSKVLDDEVAQSVGADFNGVRTIVNLSIPIMVKAIEVPGKKVVRVAGSRPPYPAQARVSGAQGDGVLKVSFDESGHVVSAEMAQSTGSKILDSNTVNYVKARWRSSGGEKVTTTLPFAYHLR